MLLIPYATDAPIYHRPIATLGLIGLNTLIYIVTAAAAGSPFLDSEAPAWINSLVLDYTTINPIQWVTSNFVHGDFVHLLANMLFLWPFGLLIEGKLGSWKFLLVYLSIGIIQCALEQCGMFLLGVEGSSLGSSAIIFGLVAICALWAPQNEFQVIFVFWWIPSQIEMKVLTICGLYLLLETLYVALGLGVGLFTASFLHMMGAVIGLGFGIVLLVTRQVDCEGWDLFTLTFHRPLPTYTSAKEQARIVEQQQAAILERQTAEDSAREAIARYLDAGHAEVAFKRVELARKELPNFDLGAPLQYRLIRELDRAGKIDASVPLIKSYLTRYTQHVVPLRIKLAHYYINKLSRPSQGMQVLATLAQQSLDAKTQSIVQRLKRQAQSLIDDGLIEVYEEEV